MARVRWLDEPQPHDYPAAANYLSLLADDTLIAAIIESLRTAPTTTQQAKDILRASGLALLPADNLHVAADLKKVRADTPLSPILLVRGNIQTGVAVQIADGYHRVCASYLTDENTAIPCRIAQLPG
jgi:hypothetical protein